MNKTIWEKNLAALGGDFDILKAALLENPEETALEGLEPGMAPVEDKEVLYVRQGEKLYQLDTLYHTDEMMSIWTKHRNLSGYCLKYIFFGMGTGMYARTFLRQADDTASILVYEPSLVLFRFIMQNIDISDILKDKRFMLIVEEYSENRFEEYLYEFMDYRDIKHLIYQAYPNYNRLFREEVKKCDDTVQYVCNDITACQTLLAEYGEKYFTSSFYNTRLLMRSKSLYDFYQRIPEGLPAIIVSSGPSLDKNIHELKRAKGKCFLIAADSAVNALLRQDIIPDIYVTIDGNKNPGHFVDERVPEIPVLCELCSSYKVLRRHKGAAFFTNDTNVYVNNFMTKKGKIFPVFSTGGSVANSAATLAATLGFRTVILVGQDLAYTGNKTHSEATLRGSWNIDVNTLDTNIMIEGIDGKPVLSSYEFKMYINWFEKFIRDNDKIHVIDATEGGAMIHGAENRRLCDAVDEYCVREVSMEEIIADTETLLNDEEREEFREYMRRIPDELVKMDKAAEDGIRCYKKILELAYAGKYMGGEITRLVRKTARITETLEDTPVMYYIQDRLQAETKRVLENVYDVKKTPREEIIDAAKTGKAYLEKMEECIRDSEKSLREIADEVF